MQILIEEMGLCDTVDPLAGSYYVETLTNQMEQEIRNLMAQVDEQGGIVRAIAEGRIQDEISRQAYERLKKIQSGEIRQVGVNCYQTPPEEQPVAFHPFKEEVLDRSRSADSHRFEPNGMTSAWPARWTGSDDARAGRNVMPGIIEAVKMRMRRWAS